MSRFSTENEIRAVVDGFESGTIARDAWGHAEHLTVALHYIDNYDLDTATEKMRNGIFYLLTAFKVDLTKEMPYHETLTIFWMRTIADFNSSRTGSSLLDRTNELVEKYDKDYPFRFYSRELLSSDEARGRFLEADRRS